MWVSRIQVIRTLVDTFEWNVNITSNYTQRVNRVTPFAIAKAALRLPVGELGVNCPKRKFHET